ncbi:MAG TPA: DUF2795 domain-containing protein [Chloroflexota bacterium]|nr:DUF2795 domain-containing protein [Chloroflexota bacterium]HEX2986664.1 DUF2795 domain-containing protein [Chloroflexota bacterium]
MAEERIDRSDVQPGAIVDYIEGVEYPCSKADIINQAVMRGAPQMVIDALQRLPDEQYYDLAYLMDRFSRVSP